MMRTLEQDARKGFAALSGGAGGSPFTTSAPGVVLVKGATGVSTLYFVNYRYVRQAMAILIGNAGYVATILQGGNVVQVNTWSGTQVATDFGYYFIVDGVLK